MADAPQERPGKVNLHRTFPYVRVGTPPESDRLKFEVRPMDDPGFRPAFDVVGREGVEELRDLCDAWLEYDADSDDVEE